MRMQSIRIAVPIILMLALASVATAADPIIGTWKLNFAKSKFPPIALAMMNRAAPKEMIDVYRAIEGNQIEFTRKEIRTDGSTHSTKAIWPQQGGDVKVLQYPDTPGPSSVAMLIEPGNWYVTYMRDGIQVAIGQKTVSQDGKTMRCTLKGIDPQRKSFERIEVFDRQ